MELLGEIGAGASSTLLSSPGELDATTGPGGLKNMSALSRKAARSGERQSVAKPRQGQRHNKPSVDADAAPADQASAQQQTTAVPPRQQGRTKAIVTVEATGPTRCGLSDRRLFGLAAVAAHVSACRAVGGISWVVGACGCCALAYALRYHDDDDELRRRRDVIALRFRGRQRFERKLMLWLERCPWAVKKLSVVFTLWRLLSAILGPASAAVYLRAVLVAMLLLASCFVYLPLHDANGRGLALSRLAGFALVAWTSLVVLDAAFGYDASAALACASWLAKPSLDTLEAKRRKLHHEKRHDLVPYLRTRDLFVALVVSELHFDTSSDRDAPLRLYLGFFGTWFVVSRESSTNFADIDQPRFERLD